MVFLCNNCNTTYIVNQSTRRTL